MPLKKPKVGPVVGLVTEDRARFMAGIQQGPSTVKVNCGWLRIKTGDDPWSEAKRFRFNKNFYFTGVIEIGGLSSATEYSYQIGYMKGFNETAIPTEEDWSGIAEHVFTTRMPCLTSLCFGSCLRHNDSRYGKTLKTVDRLNREEGVDAMLWLGDQIYNDPYAHFGRIGSSRKNFRKLYRRFMRNQDVRRVLRSMPNYMAMDDHEIENRFTRGTDAYPNKRRLINGMMAYYSYQASHGPIYNSLKSSEQENVYFLNGQDDDQVPIRYWYEVDLGDCGLFMMDTRMERDKDDMISSEQEAALKAFLQKDYRVKFVGSSVTFLADSSASSDNWGRAPEQRGLILDFIVGNSIKNVFFLSGDVHAHFACEMTINDNDLKVYELVSGSLFWPIGRLPSLAFFKKWSSFRWHRGSVRFGDPIKGRPEYKLSQPLSELDRDYYANNGVGHVAINGDELVFTIYNSNGQQRIMQSFSLD